MISLNNQKNGSMTYKLIEKYSNVLGLRRVEPKVLELVW